MKKILILAAATLMCAGVRAQNFSVKGDIKGISNGTKVELVAIEGYDRKPLATVVSKGSAFVLTGHVEHPCIAELRICDKPESEYKDDDYPQKRSVTMMVDNSPITVGAAHFDSIPLDYSYGRPTMVQEKNVTVKGGIVQKHYQEWRDFIYDTELAAGMANYKYRDYAYGIDGGQGSDPAVKKQLKAAEASCNNSLEAKNNEFAALHPDYAISLIQKQKQLEDMFKYTAEELDSMVVLFKNNEDGARYLDFCKTVDGIKAGHQVKGAHYTDASMELPDGGTKLFSDCIVKGKYNFVDFWASWCGPCRAAIPAVKDMQARYGDRLNIVSASLDKNKNEWKEAMGQEGMTWTQLLVTEEGKKILAKAYQLTSIPYLMIIDPNGCILLSTHDPDEADGYIKSKIGE